MIIHSPRRRLRAMSDSERYSRHKWAMCAYKGGRCQGSCGERVTEATINDYDFHHIDPVANGHDKSDRWGGAVRGWAPFTPKWFAWGDRVELTCRECHKETRKKPMPLIDWAAQARLDEHAKQQESVPVRTTAPVQTISIEWVSRAFSY